MGKPHLEELVVDEGVMLEGDIFLRRVHLIAAALEAENFLAFLLLADLTAS